MMIRCLLLGTFVILIGMSYPQTTIIRNSKFVALWLYNYTMLHSLWP